MALAPLNVIGSPNTHDQHAAWILTGRMDFAADRMAGRKLYGAIKASTIAHGSVKSVDATAALAEPGVKAVITYKDCPFWSQTILQWGQEVAGVIADDWYTAVRATALVNVTYDVSPTVFDPDAAMQASSPLAGARPDANLQATTTLKRGDVAAGMASADVQFNTVQPWTTTYQHNCLEMHQSVAWWTGDDLYIWGPSQNAFSAKNSYVNTLGMPSNKVHFFTHGTGGALGDKTGNPSGGPAACMSRAVGGAPVYLLYSRHDNMLFNTRMFSIRSNINWGAKKDGTIVAVDATYYSNNGRNASAPAGNAHFGLKNTYTIPNASMIVNTIVTNQPARGYYRCVNDPPGCFNTDMALYKLADKLGMDPWALIQKNLRAGDQPDQDQSKPTFWGGNGIVDCFNKVYSASSYATKYHAPNTKTLADGRKHGIAIVGHVDSHGGVNGATRGALVTMCADGTALINMGGSRATSCAPTTMVHITAEMLGMKYADVRCGEWGNTDVGLDAGGQNGSGFTGGAGGAFYNAALDLKNKLFAVAIKKAPFSTIAGITIDQLSAKDSSVFLTADPTKTMTYRTLMSGTAPQAGYGVGWASTLRTHTVGTGKIGDTCNTNGMCAAVVEVAVDTETGVVEVTGDWNAVDTGRTINRPGMIKELYSGCELHYVQAFVYGDIYDPATGACISSQFTESMLPTFKDMKVEAYNVYDIESDDAAGPYGAHGIGEPASSNYQAIICAIFNATGVWIDPDKGACTPNKILKALGKA
jgi:CO/xanthine dehydrogenase Mo-binding subunit